MTAWRTLGELAARCPPQGLGLQREAPDLLPRLEAAAAATAGSMNLQGLADVGGAGLGWAATLLLALP